MLLNSDSNSSVNISGAVNTIVIQRIEESALYRSELELV